MLEGGGGNINSRLLRELTPGDVFCTDGLQYIVNQPLPIMLNPKKQPVTRLGDGKIIFFEYDLDVGHFSHARLAH